MDQNELQCTHCGRKAFRTPTNRCMYCGQSLPEKFRLSAEELEAFKQRHHETGLQSETFASGMRRPEFPLHPEPARKPKRKKGLIRRMGAFLLETLSGTRGT